MEKHPPLLIANKFIELASKDGGITHMKLQKLVYMFYGEWLCENEDACISENPQVWQYGPVFESLYYEFKEFRANKITDQKKIDSSQSTENSKISDLVKTVWGKYKENSAFELSAMTHEPGSPWYQIAQENNFQVPIGTVIPMGLIKIHFRKTRDEERCS